MTAALKSLLATCDWSGAERYIRDVVEAAPVPMPREPLAVAPLERRVAPVLYLPVEIKSREWRSKIAIAREACHLGFTTVIGACWGMQLGGYSGWPPGVILFKSLNSLDAVNMARARENGHLIAALDEEAFSRGPGNALKTDPQAALFCDLLLAQGDAYAREHSAKCHKCDTPAVAKCYVGRTLESGVLVCQKHGDEMWKACKSQVEMNLVAWRNEDVRQPVVTGNPRADVLPKLAPGDETLVCSMSGNINGISPFDEVVARSLAMSPGVGAREAFLAAMLRELRGLKDAFDTAFDVASHAITIGSRVVFRPHPAEDHDLWRSLLWPYQVTITNTGDVADWIAGARHTYYVAGCGCGITARLMGAACTALGNGHDQALGPDYLEPGPSAPRVAQALWRLYSDHADPAYDRNSMLKRRLSYFAPAEFHANKFPPTKVEEVQAALPGLSVAQVEPNLFAVLPSLSCDDHGVVYCPECRKVAARVSA